MIREVWGFLTLTSYVSFSHPVIGALIGKQEGRNIEVMNSFELLSHTVEEKIIIDKEYYYTKEEQCERGIDVGEEWEWGKKAEWGRWRGSGKKVNRIGRERRKSEARVAEETLEKGHIHLFPAKKVRRLRRLIILNRTSMGRGEAGKNTPGISN